MARWHLLDNVIGDRRPDLGSASAVRELEATPYDDRIAAESTYDVLQLGAGRDPDAPALQFLANADPEETPVTLSYRQFIAGVTQAANMFHDLGVGPGDVVSLLLPLVPQAFLSLFGAQAAGIANPVNPLLEAGQIAQILRAAGTKVLVTVGPAASAEIWSKVQRLRGELTELKAIVVVGAPTHDETGFFAYEALASAQPADRLKSGRHIRAEDTASYFHTGGTTGMPKLVRHTHRNEVYQAWVIGLMLPSNLILFGLPLFHVGGALTQGLGMFGTGATVVVLSAAGWRNPASVRNVWRLVERYRPRVFGAVPTVLAAALAVPVGDADVSSIRCCSGGGSAIPVAVGEAYQLQFHAPVLEVYGMTETSSVHTISYSDREVRLGSVGQPVPYSRVRIVEMGAEGRYVDCPSGRIGIVAMAGPGVFSGYVSDKHNRDAFVEPGWVNSGDLGRLDEAGYLWITGRAKDLIIRGGHNIDPAPLEEILFRHPSVAFAAVVGEPDAYAGELPVAYVQLKPGSRAEAAELAEYIASQTPERAATPVHVYLLDAMPLTGVGKVFKPQLRWDAAERKVGAMLSDLDRPGLHLAVSVAPHDLLGSLITVRAHGPRAPQPERDALEDEVHARLAPLVTRHEIVWE
ncbi:MAG TPA: acyl-CoA synthetase [Ramlibacter sp.]|uniref:acyl-CoA synthetase n=1 Tax=Ramlibacter sp. TaxID=1917967 RepID=UPI002C45C60E|nr:acyl-CoA synthetase [Ramlibacter sp.]HVZ46396.1 acyl-CoA synthetase [Ramlibacter sp.]